MERRGAVVLLAGLADWDVALLKRAALGVASEWTNCRASELLIDAAQERAPDRRQLSSLDDGATLQARVHLRSGL